MESSGFRQVFDSGNQIWYYNNIEKIKKVPPHQDIVHP